MGRQPARGWHAMLPSHGITVMIALVIFMVAALAVEAQQFIVHTNGTCDSDVSTGLVNINSHGAATYVATNLSVALEWDDHLNNPEYTGALPNLTACTRWKDVHIAYPGCANRAASLISFVTPTNETFFANASVTIESICINSLPCSTLTDLQGKSVCSAPSSDVTHASLAVEKAPLWQPESADAPAGFQIGFIALTVEEVTTPLIDCTSRACGAHLTHVNATFLKVPGDTTVPLLTHLDGFSDTIRMRNCSISLNAAFSGAVVKSNGGTVHVFGTEMHLAGALFVDALGGADVVIDASTVHGTSQLAVASGGSSVTLRKTVVSGTDVSGTTFTPLLSMSGSVLMVQESIFANYSWTIEEGATDLPGAMLFALTGAAVAEVSSTQVTSVYVEEVVTDGEPNPAAVAVVLYVEGTSSATLSSNKFTNITSVQGGAGSGCVSLNGGTLYSFKDVIESVNITEPLPYENAVDCASAGAFVFTNSSVANSAVIGIQQLEARDLVSSGAGTTFCGSGIFKADIIDSSFSHISSTTSGGLAHMSAGTSSLSSLSISNVVVVEVVYFRPFTTEQAQADVLSVSDDANFPTVTIRFATIATGAGDDPRILISAGKGASVSYDDLLIYERDSGDIICENCTSAGQATRVAWDGAKPLSFDTRTLGLKTGARLLLPGQLCGFSPRDDDYFIIDSVSQSCIPTTSSHECQEGFFVEYGSRIDSIACTPCPEGTFSNATNGAIACDPCAFGFTTEEVASVSEDACVPMSCSQGFFPTFTGLCFPCHDLGSSEAVLRMTLVLSSFLLLVLAYLSYTVAKHGIKSHTAFLYVVLQLTSFIIGSWALYPAVASGLGPIGVGVDSTNTNILRWVNYFTALMTINPVGMLPGCSLGAISVRSLRSFVMMLPVGLLIFSYIITAISQCVARSKRRRHGQPLNRAQYARVEGSDGPGDTEDAFKTGDNFGSFRPSYDDNLESRLAASSQGSLAALLANGGGDEQEEAETNNAASGTAKRSDTIYSLSFAFIVPLLYSAFVVLVSGGQIFYRETVTSSTFILFAALVTLIVGIVCVANLITLSFGRGRKDLPIAYRVRRGHVCLLLASFLFVVTMSMVASNDLSLDNATTAGGVVFGFFLLAFVTHVRELGKDGWTWVGILVILVHYIAMVHSLDQFGKPAGRALFSTTIILMVVLLFKLYLNVRSCLENRKRASAEEA